MVAVAGSRRIVMAASLGDRSGRVVVELDLAAGSSGGAEKFGTVESVEECSPRCVSCEGQLPVLKGCVLMQDIIATITSLTNGINSVNALLAPVRHAISVVNFVGSAWLRPSGSLF